MIETDEGRPVKMAVEPSTAVKVKKALKATIAQVQIAYGQVKDDIDARATHAQS